MARFRPTRGPVLKNKVDGSRGRHLQLTCGRTCKHIPTHASTHKDMFLSFQELRSQQEGALSLSQELVEALSMSKPTSLFLLLPLPGAPLPRFPTGKMSLSTELSLMALRGATPLNKQGRMILSVHAPSSLLGGVSARHAKCTVGRKRLCCFDSAGDHQKV